MNLMDRLTSLLAGTNGVIAVVVLAVLALLFLVLWLLGRGGGGKGGADELRRVTNELKVARGDLMQERKHDHTAELTKLTRELDNLRAVAGGKMPPGARRVAPARRGRRGAPRRGAGRARGAVPKTHGDPGEGGRPGLVRPDRDRTQHLRHARAHHRPRAGAGRRAGRSSPRPRAASRPSSRRSSTS